MSRPVLFVGRIYTSFNPIKIVEAIIAFNGVVVYAGNLRDAEKICGVLGCETIDLGNRVAIPGFVDSHMHLVSYGRYLSLPDLRGCRSIDEVKRILRDFAKNIPPSRWVIARGWDQELFAERRPLTRWDLDEAVGAKPAIAVRICGHMATLSSKALEVLGRNYLEKFSRYVDPDTGIVREDAVGYALTKALEGETIDDRARYIEEAQRKLLEHGIVGIGYVSVALEDLLAVLSCARSGRLRLYVSMYLDLETARRLDDLGLFLPISLGRARVSGIKILADGSLGARTAWLSEPYSDDPTTSGTPCIDADTVRRAAELCRSRGLTLAVHAIGDRALDMVLNAVLPDLASFVRIEHASLVRDDQLEGVSKLFGVSIQPHFVLTDWWAVRRVGVERCRWLYRFRTLARIARVVGISSDAPVEPIDPFETIYAAVDRGASEGLDIARCCPDEALDVATALSLYTEGSAKLIGLEGVLGRLEPGYRACIAVLDRDPMEVDVQELRRIRVVETYVDGERAI